MFVEAIAIRKPSLGRPLDVFLITRARQPFGEAAAEREEQGRSHHLVEQRGDEHTAEHDDREGMEDLLARLVSAKEQWE